MKSTVPAGPGDDVADCSELCPYLRVTLGVDLRAARSALPGRLPPFPSSSDDEFLSAFLGEPL